MPVSASISPPHKLSPWHSLSLCRPSPNLPRSQSQVEKWGCVKVILGQNTGQNAKLVLLGIAWVSSFRHLALHGNTVLQNLHKLTQITNHCDILHQDAKGDWAYQFFADLDMLMWMNVLDQPRGKESPPVVHPLTSTGRCMGFVFAL